MATQVTQYNQIPQRLITGTINIAGDTIKAALVTSAYTPDAAHTEWSQVSTHEVDDISYEAKTIANIAVTANTITADDVSWASLSATFRYLVVYAEVTRDGLTNPLIQYHLLDDTPADVTVADADYTPAWDGGVVMDLARVPCP